MAYKPICVFSSYCNSDTSYTQCSKVALQSMYVVNCKCIKHIIINNNMRIDDFARCAVELKCLATLNISF